MASTAAAKERRQATAKNPLPLTLCEIYIATIYDWSPYNV
uniref:Uncharacterized protein n=1 Tax=Anguilla anguilla TaxID=7936 RepID=A0A0E9PRK5_ANGAN